ncbi:cytochrome c-type biogenesis protein [Aquihabitans sp. McL0605]|uniref:cytochrome c-type biogenesis protein n=1 Tax=Aquihabitans sp. McL0605 TaxID=3415671 RepID=UPI003CECFB84
MSTSPASSSSSSRAKPWLPWIAMAVVVLIALAVGTLGQAPPTDAERAQNVAETIRCPSCKSQSVASSDTPASQGVRALIKQRIAVGDSDEEIRDFVASRYGRQILLDPSGSGFGTLVWALPVIFVIVAIAGLIYRFRDYRPSSRGVTQADRDLVAVALDGEDPP